MVAGLRGSELVISQSVESLVRAGLERLGLHALVLVQDAVRPAGA